MRDLFIFVICLLIGFVMAVSLKAQSDPLLDDARYYGQARAALIQEQRANSLQIELIQRRQKEIENLLKFVDDKIKQLNAKKDLIEPPAGAPDDSKVK